MLADGEDYLSVNCTEYEPLENIAEYYIEELQKGKSPAKISLHSVAEYIRVFRQQGQGRVVQDPLLGECFVDNDRSNKKLFRHRPVTYPRSSGTVGKIPSLSHSGAEFLRTMDRIRAKAFANKMANRKYIEVD